VVEQPGGAGEPRSPGLEALANRRGRGATREQRAQLVARLEPQAGTQPPSPLRHTVTSRGRLASIAATASWTRSSGSVTVTTVSRGRGPESCAGSSWGRGALKM